MTFTTGYAQLHVHTLVLVLAGEEGPSAYVTVQAEIAGGGGGGGGGKPPPATPNENMVGNWNVTAEG